MAIAVNSSGISTVVSTDPHNFTFNNVGGTTLLGAALMSGLVTETINSATYNAVAMTALAATSTVSVGGGISQFARIFYKLPTVATGSNTLAVDYLTGTAEHATCAISFTGDDGAVPTINTAVTGTGTTETMSFTLAAGEIGIAFGSISTAAAAVQGSLTTGTLIGSAASDPFNGTTAWGGYRTTSGDIVWTTSSSFTYVIVGCIIKPAAGGATRPVKMAGEWGGYAGTSGGFAG